ncbi:MAG: AraC family transcriptional regulator [Kiritimatiellae bacterium]|nr:AraC family transcriptional regulator [Kiritimatiellia bacterium]
MALHTHAPNAIILWANDAQFPPGTRIEFPEVRSRMLLWCRGGRGTVTVNGDKHVLTAGDFLFMPWRHHIRYVADAGVDWYLGGVHVVPDHRRGVDVRFRVQHTPEDRKPWYRFHGDAALPGFETVLSGRLEHAESLQHLTDYIVAWFRRPTRNEASARALAGVLLDELEDVAGTLAAPYGCLPANLKRMMSHVPAHLHEPVAIASLADIAHCSPSTVSRLFRRYLGISPGQWIMKQKMEHASTLLATTTLRVAQVGRRVGIDDPYYFSKAFKKYRQVTALKYRQMSGGV